MLRDGAAVFLSTSVVSDTPEVTGLDVIVTDNDIPSVSPKDMCASLGLSSL